MHTVSPPYIQCHPHYHPHTYSVTPITTPTHTVSPPLPPPYIQCHPHYHHHTYSVTPITTPTHTVSPPLPPPPPIEMSPYAPAQFEGQAMGAPPTPVLPAPQQMRIPCQESITPPPVQFIPPLNNQLYPEPVYIERGLSCQGQCHLLRSCELITFIFFMYNIHK